MAKTKAATDLPFTADERRRFLYRTVEEMRSINDRADARRVNDLERDGEAKAEVNSGGKYGE